MTLQAQEKKSLPNSSPTGSDSNVDTKANNPHQIEIDAPPPYDSSSASISQASNVPVPPITVIYAQTPYQQEHQQLQQYYPHEHGRSLSVVVTKAALPKITTEEPAIPKKSCFAAFLSPIIDPAAWASCLYFMIISITIAHFAFGWILGTFIGAVASLLFPPIGYFFCIGTAWSWRALGRLELVTVTLCTHPSSFFHASRSDVPLPPVFRVSQKDEGWIHFATSLCFDKHTWLCLLYFLFIKSVIALVTFVLTTLLFVGAFSPFMLIGLPLMCLVCKKMGEWQVQIARVFLLA